MTKCLYALIVLSVAASDLGALALRPLSAGSEQEQYEAVTGSLLLARADLTELVRQEPTCRDAVKLFLYLEARLHDAEVADKDGHVYKIFAEVTEDGVLQLSLKDEAAGTSQAIAGIDLVGSADIDLEKVDWDRGPRFQDLTHRGIGTAVVEKIRPYVPKECNLNLMVVNKPTRTAMVTAKPDTLAQLTALFKGQVIGRWLDMLGFNQFIFKLLPAEWNEFDCREVTEAVTDALVPMFIEQTAKYKGFFVLARKIDYAGECARAGAEFIGIQEGIDEIEDMVLFNAPNHTTLALEKSKFSSSAAFIKVSEAMAERTLVRKADMEFGGPRGELVLKDDDYLLIVKSQKPSFRIMEVLEAA